MKNVQNRIQNYRFKTNSLIIYNEGLQPLLHKVYHNLQFD